MTNEKYGSIIMLNPFRFRLVTIDKISYNSAENGSLLNRDVAPVGKKKGVATPFVFSVRQSLTEKEKLSRRNALRGGK